MNGNKIGNKGGMALAGALQVNTVLEELDLGEADLVSKIEILCSKDQFIFTNRKNFRGNS